MSSKIFYCTKVVAYGILCIITKLEFFQHHFSKMGHGNTSCDPHLHLSHSSYQRSATSREASAAGRLRPNAETGCAVKGGGPQRELNPPGNWFAPPGSNQSSSGGNETAEASGAEGREGDLASIQAVT